MGGTLNARSVSIRGYGKAQVQGDDAGSVTVDCHCRLLPGRPYVLQGMPGQGDGRRMRVVASSVHVLQGEAGVVYRVTLRADA